MPRSQYIAIAAEALETMGFELMSDEGDKLLEYWHPLPPYAKVVMHDHELTEQRHLRDAVMRQLDTDAQRANFAELTGW